MADVEAGRLSISPRLLFKVEHSYSPFADDPGSVVVTHQGLQVHVYSPEAIIHVGRAECDRPMNTLTSRSPLESTYALVLDHYELNELEKIRGGGDLSLVVLASHRIYFRDRTDVQEFSLSHTIARSKWVEEILPAVGFKRVHLIEVPKLRSEEFAQAIDHLNEAWRQLSMGSYDKTLVDCRKALESLTEVAKKNEYIKEISAENGKKIEVPDFGKILGSDRMDETVLPIFRRIKDFMAPGAHAGKAINREDADFALMCVHGLVNLVVRKLS